MKTQTLLRTAGGSWGAYAGSPLAQPDLILFFGGSTVAAVSDHYQSLQASYPAAQIAGCSTAGEIVGDEVLDEGGVAVAIRLDQSTLRCLSVPLPEDSAAAGRMLAHQLAAPDLRAVFLLSDGHDVNGSQLVAGLGEALPPGVVLSGGLAGDGGRFVQTAVACNGPAQAGQIAAVGFYGAAFEAQAGSFGGWEPFGPVRHITRARDNVLYELDGQPALHLYKQYLGEAARELPGSALRFPLQLTAPEAGAEGIVRTILSIDEAAQSLTFAGDMPEGYRVQLMMASFEGLIDGAGTAARQVQLADAAQGSDHLAILVSCVGRKIVLGQRTEAEVEAVVEVLPPHTQTIGFYSYGEVSPQGLARHCRLHNQTMTITCYSEKG